MPVLGPLGIAVLEAGEMNSVAGRGAFGADLAVADPGIGGSGSTPQCLQLLEDDAIDCGGGMPPEERQRSNYSEEQYISDTLRSAGVPFAQHLVESIIARNIDVEDVITTYKRGNWYEVVADSDHVGQTVIYDARTQLMLPLNHEGEVVNVLEKSPQSVNNLVDRGSWIRKRHP